MCFLCLCCNRKTTALANLPKAPDYADTTQWYDTWRNNNADIFYITSTETGDYHLPDGSLCHFADTYADSLRRPIYAEMQGVDTLLSGSLNFFSPYYRQCSLQSFQDEAVARERLTIATDDIRRAFRHYLDHQNHGRAFILAGFSQGAIIMLELLREMDEETFNRMIAAYAIGIGISRDELAENKHIRPAQKADDTGVTICYNSVRDYDAALWHSAVAINPVNWRTDTISAQLITEPTPLLPIAVQQKDTLTVRLDTATGLLLVGGYSANDYALPLIGRDGNYHTREIWLYRDRLRENMTLRAQRFANNR